MKTLISIVAAGLLATGSAALAAGETGAAGMRANSARSGKAELRAFGRPLPPGALGSD